MPFTGWQSTFSGLWIPWVKAGSGKLIPQSVLSGDAILPKTPGYKGGIMLLLKKLFQNANPVTA
jgi:hypothetical protein